MSVTLLFINFLKLHKILVSRMILFDFILGVLGSIFLLIPLDNFALSLDNLPLLVLFIFLTVVYQIHIFRTYTGGITFYLNLPVKKYYFFIILFIDTIIPLLIALLITMIVFVFSHISQSVPISTKLVVRICDTVLIFFILKTIALPIFVLYKKHIGLILLFLFSLAFIYELISFSAELVHIHSIIYELIFFASVEIICIKILSNAKIN